MGAGNTGARTMSDFRVHGSKPVGMGQDAIMSSTLLQPLSRGDTSRPSRGEDIDGGKKPPLSIPDSLAPRGQATGEVSAEAVAERINAVIRMLNTRVTFEVNRETGDVIIKLIDAATGQVIREIPPHELQAVAITLAELAGALVDRKG